SSRIADRLEDVSGLVSSSVDKFNNEMERMLANRKDALDGLIGDASRRAQEVDSVMSNYMSTIEDSLNSAEQRSKDISRVIAEQSARAAENLEQEIRKLEASSGGQITQASRILREQHERAMAQMSEMLSSTASDFQQTAQDMRITAQQVVKDIDSARSELKRAIMDLPEETRSNADAMRRVVADQIAALNTLAEVVRRQAGGLDASGPGASLIRSSERSAPGKSEGAPFTAPQSGTGSALGNLMERRPGNTPAPLRSRDVADFVKSGAPRAAASNATRDMDALIAKLNVAARELVEALEGELPKDLEKSYDKGERDAYTHWLFAARGKRRQKEIGERYESERTLRTRVDAYVRMFERFLDVVSDSPQGENLVEACLASESGKIYVMLAEATGRMPQK
ncbi:MAG: hypothetical protein ACKVP5_18030, partial [Aestuariivirga sp.]